MEANSRSNLINIFRENKSKFMIEWFVREKLVRSN